MSRDYIDPERLMNTNLGVSRAIRCCIPLRKSQYVFGKPSNNVSERATLALVKELSKDCRHFLDVGAHEGIYTFSVFATRGTDIVLHWFEPDKILADRFSHNLEQNKIIAWGNRVAVAHRSGSTTFFRNLSDDLSGSISPYFKSKHTTQPEMVNTLNLSDYFRERQISRALVKVDVEGAGSEVWLGLENTFKTLTYLIIEMLEPEITTSLPSKIIDQTGWYAYYIRDIELVEATNGEFEYVEPFWNWLFCELNPGSLARRLRGSPFRVITAPRASD